jgi:hypothetical protein
MSPINILCLHHPNDSEKSAVRALGGRELNAIVDEFVTEMSEKQKLNNKQIAKQIFAVNPNSIQNWRGRNSEYPEGHPVPLWALEKCLQSNQNSDKDKARIRIIKNIEELQCGRVGKTVKAVTELNPSIAKLCGAHAADGSLYLQAERGPITSLWEIGDQVKENIEAVQQWTKELFNVQLDIKKKGAMYYVRSDMQVIPRYLIRVFDFPTGEKSHTVREPSILSDSRDGRVLGTITEEERWSLRLDFAKEVVNFDGHSTKTGGIVSVGLGSESSEMRKNLCEIFERFGVKFRNYDAHNKMLTTSWEQSRKLFDLGLFRGQRRTKFKISLCNYRTPRAEKYPERGVKRA